MFKSDKYLSLIALIFWLIAVAGCSSSGDSEEANPNTGGINPQVTYTIIANGATNVPLNTKIGAFFTDEMDPNSVNTSTFILRQGSTLVSGDVTYNSLGAIFTPFRILDPNATYTATITSGARDLAGTPLAKDYTWSWSTGSAFDTSIPTVIRTVNPDGATDVPLNTKIMASFSKVMDPSTISLSTLSFMQGATQVPGKVTYLGLSLVFTPEGNLAPNTNYTCTITTGVKDFAGNSLPENYVWSWSTGTRLNLTTPYIQYTTPTLTPVIQNALPAAASMISQGVLAVSAIFSEPMDPLTINTLTFTLTDGINPVAGSVIYNGQSMTASFFPLANLEPNKTYSATITTGVKSVSGISLASAVTWTFTTSPAIGQVPVNLGSAANFAILAGSTITNTGNTTIYGDIGLSPGTALTGFPPGTVNGVLHLADSTAAAAKLDLAAAFNDAAGRIGVSTVPTELGGSILPPGVYNSAAGTFGITGTLTLDGRGDPNAVFIFQAASTLITASSSRIDLINGAQAKNIFWQVGSSATLGTYSVFKGTILAQASITVTTGSVIEGRALTQSAAVTLDTNTITTSSTPPVGQGPVNLGTAANFAILAGSTITNTGNTLVNGDIGLSPGTAVTGFPPGSLNGFFHISDPAALAAKIDLTTAFNEAAARQGRVIMPSDLGGLRLTPGVYGSAAGTFGITGTLTLDAQGDANAVFIFQAASTLITASNSLVVLVNGAQAKNIFWQVGSSATIGTYSIFKGTIMAQAAITVTTGAIIDGRALAQTAAVTLDSNIITATPAPVVGQAPLNLGTAANFAILAGSTITNTGNTLVNGDIGLSPGTAVTGFPPGTLNGVFHLSDTTAQTAKLDLTAAFNEASGRPVSVIVPTELGGTTITPGVYGSAAGTFGITGTLVLDAQGDANAVFIFRAASTLITASTSRVVLLNGAQASNVFWQVGSSATIGTYSIFKGTILAQASITVTTGATMEGRALAQTAAVTLDTNMITR